MKHLGRLVEERTYFGGGLAVVPILLIVLSAFCTWAVLDILSRAVVYGQPFEFPISETPFWQHRPWLAVGEHGGSMVYLSSLPSTHH